LSQGGEPFQIRIKIPELKINARYTSSGVLFILPASGQGNFHSTLGMSLQNTLYITPEESFFLVEKAVSCITEQRLLLLALQSFGRVLYQMSTESERNLESRGHFNTRL